MLRVLSIILSLSLLSPIALGDDHGHDHGPGPNGGVIGEFGDFHVEGIVAETAAGFYIIDADGKKAHTIKSHSGGRLTIVPAKGKVINKTIKAGKNFGEAFAKIKKNQKIKMIRLQLKVKGKTWKAKVKF